MPIFEFRCPVCRKKTTALVMVRARADEVRCQHCGADGLVKLMSRFATPLSEDARLDRLAQPSNLPAVDENDPSSVTRWMKQMGHEMGEDLGDELDQALESEMSVTNGGAADSTDET